MWMFALLACTKEPVEPIGARTQPPPTELRGWTQPHLPDEPLYARVENPPDELLAEITGPDGVRRTLEGVDLGGNLVAWRPETEWTPGIYRVRKLFGIVVREPFTLRDFGPYQPPQEGDAYRVDPDQLIFYKPAGLAGLPLVEQPVLWIEVMSVDGDELVFRIVAEDSSYVCSAHTAAATLSETGHVSWSTPELSFHLLDSYGSVEDVSIDFDLLGTGLGRLRAVGAVDTSPLGVLLGPNVDDDAICTLAGQFDIPCETCRTGSPNCLGVEIAGFIPSSLDTPPWDPAEELPPCAGPTADDLPGSECDSGCSSASGSPLFTLLPGLLLLRRRRR